MVKINPNNNSVLNLRKCAEMKNTEETKIKTRTYEPTAPLLNDLVGIDNSDILLQKMMKECKISCIII